MQKPRFADTAVVACGTVRPEIEHLAKKRFLDTPHLFYIPAGLQNNERELEFQLTRQVKRARSLAQNVLLVYGTPYIGISLDRFKTKMLGQLKNLKRQGPASPS